MVFQRAKCYLQQNTFQLLQYPEYHSRNVYFSLQLSKTIHLFILQLACSTPAALQHFLECPARHRALGSSQCSSIELDSLGFALRQLGKYY